MLSPILQEIQRYSQAVESGSVCCELEECPRCGKAPGEFRFHDARRRKFLCVIGRLVEAVTCWLGRWKCPLCNKTFTLYPAFAFPRKRYVAQTVSDLTERYLSEERTSYRQAVLREGMPIFHSELSAGSSDSPVLALSTLYRWVAFFAGLRSLRREALRLIRAKDPSSDVFRRVEPVAPGKYRSPERKGVLRAAREFFVAAQEYAIRLGASVFPRLATACSWT